MSFVEANVKVVNSVDACVAAESGISNFELSMIDSDGTTTTEEAAAEARDGGRGGAGNSSDFSPAQYPGQT